MPKMSFTANSALRQQKNKRREIGAEIARARQAIGMSQATLADLFGVSSASISQYELGVRGVDSGDLEFLAGILQVSISRLLSLDRHNFQLTPEEQIEMVYVTIKEFLENVRPPSYKDVTPKTKE
jgi:transcriptional regulator with XRE-family HTH domain